MYHIIGYPRSPREVKYCCTPENFLRQMSYLKESLYQPISLDELVQALESGDGCPENGVVVTFDDGFAEVYEHAMPILRRLQIPATVFVVSEAIAGSNVWMTEENFPERRILSKQQLTHLRDEGFCIGSHSRTHPRLTALNKDDLEKEIRISKSILEDTLNVEISYFAYPYGAHNDSVLKAVIAAGHRAACVTRSGFNNRESDPFALRRIEVLGTDSLWQFRQKLKYGTNHADIALPLRYYTKRAFEKLTVRVRST